jgi:hypothetical protein
MLAPMALTLIGVPGIRLAIGHAAYVAIFNISHELLCFASSGHDTLIHLLSYFIFWGTVSFLVQFVGWNISTSRFRAAV